MTEWAGDSPFCLVIKPDAGGPVLIDLDQPGWLTTFEHLLRVPGEWILARKENSEPVLQLRVAEGEKPYYMARVYTAFMPPAGWHGLVEIDLSDIRDKARVKIWGIGKELVSGQFDRLWVLPTGVICGGDDDGPLADQLAKQRLAALLQERINGPDQRGEGDEANVPQAEGRRRARPDGQRARQRTKRIDGHPAVELDAAPGVVAEPGHKPRRGAPRGRRGRGPAVRPGNTERQP